MERERDWLVADYSLEITFKFSFLIFYRNFHKITLVQLPVFLFFLGESQALPVLCPFPDPSNSQASCSQMMSRLRNLSILSITYTHWELSCVCSIEGPQIKICFAISNVQTFPRETHSQPNQSQTSHTQTHTNLHCREQKWKHCHLGM